MHIIPQILPMSLSKNFFYIPTVDSTFFSSQEKFEAPVYITNTGQLDLLEIHVVMYHTSCSMKLACSGLS